MYTIEDFSYELYSQVESFLSDLFRTLSLNHLTLFFVHDPHSGSISKYIHLNGQGMQVVKEPKYIESIHDIFTNPSIFYKDNVPLFAHKDNFSKNYLSLYPFDSSFSCLVCPVKSRNDLIGIVVCHSSDINRVWASEDIIKVMGIAVKIKRDVEKILAIESLKAAEQMQKFVLSNMRDAIMTYSPEGTITYISTGVSNRYLGYEAHELVGKNCAELIHPDYLSLAFHYIQETRQGIIHEYHEYPIRSKDGNYSWFRLHCQPIMNEKGELTGFVSVVYSVENEIKSKKDLEKSEEKYRLLAENMHDLVVTFDLGFKPLYISPSVTKFLGFSVDDIKYFIRQPGIYNLGKHLSKNSRKLISNFIKNKVSSISPDSIDPNDATILDLEMIHKDGTIVSTETCVSFMINPRTDEINILSVTRKKSDRKNIYVDIGSTQPSTLKELKTTKI